MCGENSMIVNFEEGSWGSPPRVRGKQVAPKKPAKYYRITPACAGKTVLLRLKRLRAKDHPRVCGENKSKIPD